jgi:hypothetical protein
MNEFSFPYAHGVPSSASDFVGSSAQKGPGVGFTITPSILSFAGSMFYLVCLINAVITTHFF